MKGNDIIYERTELGEDVKKLIDMLLRLNKLKQEKARLRLVKLIDRENQRFKRRWKKDGIDFVVKVFG